MSLRLSSKARWRINRERKGGVWVILKWTAGTGWVMALLSERGDKGGEVMGSNVAIPNWRLQRDITSRWGHPQASSIPYPIRLHGKTS